MKQHKAWQNFCLGLVLSACCIAPAFEVLAQPAIDLNQFRPSERTKDGFAVSTADDMGHLNIGVQLYADFTDDPLVFEEAAGVPGSEVLQLVHRQLTGHLQLSLGLWDRLVVFVGLPYHFILEEDSDDTADIIANTLPLPTGDGLGDIWLGARVRLYGESDDLFQIAVQGTVDIHTAALADRPQVYRGGPHDNAHVGAHPELLFTFNLLDNRLRVSSNLGYRIRQNQTLAQLNLGDELTFGLGLIGGALRKGEHSLDAILEAYGRTGLSTSTGSSGFGDREESPIEVIGGVKYHHKNGFTAGIGGGAGVQRGYGSPDFRAFAMLGYAMPGTGGPGDIDGDGIPDEEDQCPHEPEDVDTYEDEDGCPDPDNDFDGVLDVDDGAPLDPEDKDGFEDEDGVPDVDNDQDGVLDVDDRCPDVPGAVENHGCPDPDDDGDGVPNRIDNCPNEPGSVENNGCKERQLVEIKDDRLEILEKVYFRTNKATIRSRSFKLLDNVARVINAHPEITSIQVEGHTDARGSERYNLRLSQRRAEAVVRYLRKKGRVSANRLTSVGFGEAKLVNPSAKTKEEHAANRRVEFNIIGEADSAIEKQDNTPDEDTIDR